LVISVESESIRFGRRLGLALERGSKGSNEEKGGRDHKVR
jgi:hypothetical protein